MACRVCRICRFSLPNAADMNPCPVCDRETTFIQDGEPDVDWKIAVEYAVARRVLPKERQRREARSKRLTKCGFAGIELTLLSESDADLHTIEHLIEHGCPTTLAVHIVL